MTELERTPVAERVHRVHWFAGRVGEVLDDLTGHTVGGGVRVAGLTAAETVETLTELTAAANRVEGLRLAVLAHADRLDLAAESGATSTGAWLAHTTRTPHPVAHRQVTLARRLDTGFEATATALQAGRIDPAQAAEVVTAVDALPARVGTADRTRAEHHLLAEATGTTGHDAKALRVLGKRLLEVLDPEAAEAELGRRLEAEERLAARRTYLRLHDDGAGSTHGTFQIPTLHGTLLTRALHALTSPARPDPIPRTTPDNHGDRPVEGPRRVLLPELLGQAFCQYLERFPTHRLPTTAGTAATVVVTIPLTTLLDGLGVATLDTGGHLSAGQARRLACQHGIIPAVLDGPSEVLDLGRKRRLHTPAQRLALGLRDTGCTAEGCDRPTGWCQAHHDLPWSAGGPTTVTNGRLLCPRHHTLIHHPDYTATTTNTGRIRLTKTNRRRQ
jgi:hypothetical protein